MVLKNITKWNTSLLSGRNLVPPYFHFNWFFHKSKLLVTFYIWLFFFSPFPEKTTVLDIQGFRSTATIYWLLVIYIASHCYPCIFSINPILQCCFLLSITLIPVCLHYATILMLTSNLLVPRSTWWVWAWLQNPLTMFLLLQKV